MHTHRRDRYRHQMHRHARFALLAGMLGSAAGAQAQTAPTSYSGPQAVLYIGDKWCAGGSCSGNAYTAFEEAFTRALIASGYVRPVRRPEGANLELKATISDGGGSGRVCLPIVGCLSGRGVRASVELVDPRSGEVRYQDSCEGASGGISTWGRWFGSLSFNSDEGRAAADCAGKLVNKLIASPSLKTYLTVAPGNALATAGSAASGTASASAARPSLPASAGAAAVGALELALKTLSFSDINAQFTADPYNPVKLKALVAAATQTSLNSAARMKLSVAPGENAGAYQLIGVSYTLPNGTEKFVQLAVTSDPTLNPRGGARLLYMSALNPLRAANPALDGVSKNVETLLNDLHAALGLPGL